MGSPSEGVRRRVVILCAVNVVAEVNEINANTKICFLQMDLTPLASIKAAAVKITARPSSRLHILMLNVGIMAWPAALTKDGYETQFGTNFVGHALLTKLLMPTLQATAPSEATADVRFVTLTKQAENWAP